MNYAIVGLAVLALCGACSSDEDAPVVVNPPSQLSSVYIAVGEKENTDADVSFINATKGDMVIVDLDDSGLCKQMDYLSDEKQTMQSILFNDDGLPESVVTEVGVISFANYNGKQVDIAVIDGDNMEIHKEVECQVDWDILKGDLKKVAAQKRSCAPTRGAITDVVLAIDKWLKDNNEAICLTFDAIDNAMMGAEISERKAVILKDGIDGVQNWVLPGLEKVVKGDGESTNSDVHLATTSAMVDLMKEVVQKSTYGVLKWVLTNYPMIEEKFENGFYTLFTVLDGNSENIALGQGALNSGYGTLKVTMAWGFYADVDVHAYEPSGTHIYYGNMRSLVTGGFLDVDDRQGGPGAVENIYWETPEDGEYVIDIDYYSNSTLNGEYGTGMVKITIFRDGKGRVFNIPLGVDETKHVAEVSMPDGTVIETRSSGAMKIKIPYEKKN